MMIRLFFIYFCSLQGALWALVSGSLSDERPQFTLISPSDHNLGPVYRGQTLIRFFEFENTGAAPLILRSFHVSSPALQIIIFPGNFLQPGEKGVIEATLRSIHLKPGFFSERITLDSNLPESQSTILTLSGHILDEVELDKEFLEYDVLSHTWSIGEGTFSVSLNPQSCAPSTQSLSHLRGFEHLPPAIQKILVTKKNPEYLYVVSLNQMFDVVPQPKQNGRYRFQLKSHPDHLKNRKDTESYEIIQIWNNSCYSPLREIPVHLTHTPPLVVDRSYLDFGWIPPQRERTASIPITIKKSAVSSYPLSVSLEISQNYTEDVQKFLKKHILWEFRPYRFSPSKGELRVHIQNPTHSSSQKSAINVNGVLKIKIDENSSYSVHLPIHAILGR